MPSKSELKALGERKGWTAGEISVREIQHQMSAEEVLWHEAFNRENVDRAFERQRIAKHNREAMDQWAIKRMWQGKVTPDEDAKARAAGNEFAIRFPTFERTVENAQIMVEYMRDHDLDATELASYITAFQELTAGGKLTLAKAQSAQDFYNEHKELHPTQLPPIVVSRNAKRTATEKFFAQAREATATARSGATSLTDYPHEQRGAPPYSDIEKTSFRNLLNNLSAQEFAERCKDPQFKAAADRVGEK
jgi:hypothetical protein